MKHTRRILCAILTLVMVLGTIPSLCFATAAEEPKDEVNLAAEYALSMIMYTRGDMGDNCIEELTNGIIKNSPDYWTLGGSGAYWTDAEVVDGETMPNEPKPLEENPCVVEADLGDIMTITAISAGFVESAGRYYHWEVYASNDSSLPISEWTKIAEKKNDKVTDGTGYRVDLDKPFEARFVRFYGVYCNDSNQVVMNEFGIFGPEHVYVPRVAPKPTNLVSAPHANNSRTGGTNVWTSIIGKSDRNDIAYWLGNGVSDLDYHDDYWTSGAPYENPIEKESNAWYSVDLGHIAVIDAVTVIERLGNASSSNLKPVAPYYTNWEVYASNDENADLSTWVKIAEKKNDEVACYEGYTAKVNQPVAARYLRIYGTKVVDGPSSSFQVSEIKVWGGMDSMVKFEGHQMGLDGKSIRLVGSVNNIDLDKVAMLVEVASAGKSMNLTTTTVYETLQYKDASGALVNAFTAKGSGVEAQEEADGNYIYGFAITDIDPGTYVFKITPVATMSDGSVYYGQTAYIDVVISG